MSVRVRPAAVAGTFYPASAQVLRSTVEKLLREAAEPGGPLPKAIIAPHAGYVYSGPVAASAFQAGAAGRIVERVVILGPAHFVPIHGLALPDTQRFATPLGEIAVDPEGAQAAIRLPQVRIQPAAHAQEHSLEVELPFLQVLLGEGFRIVPLVVGDAGGEEVAEVLERLWGGPETLIVISSDLSHYLPYEQARQADGETARQIVGLEGPLHGRQACGARPINGLMVASRRFGLVPELLDLRNSGDTAGDRDRVVGYGAFAFREAA